MNSRRIWAVATSKGGESSSTLPVGASTFLFPMNRNVYVDINLQPLRGWRKFDVNIATKDGLDQVLSVSIKDYLFILTTYM